MGNQRVSYSAEQIAKYFICKAREEKEEGKAKEISPLKLQKILYYAQGWYLGSQGAPLFPEDIYAWQYGPVVKEIYHKYKSFGSSNLAAIPTIECEDNNITDPDVIRHLDKIWNTYKAETAENLVERTHKSTPWLTAYSEPFSDIIEKDVMMKHFAGLLN